MEASLALLEASQGRRRHRCLIIMALLGPCRSRLPLREGDWGVLYVGGVALALLVSVRQTNVLLTGPPFSLSLDVDEGRDTGVTLFSHHIKVGS